MNSHVLNRPNVAKQWEADRAKGYTFATSVADLIDNSIGEGQASKISLNFEIVGEGELKFFLADNGIGMDKGKLFDAMTEGSDSSAPKHELSKFGYGMKTASWAHARRLVVVTRPKGKEDTPSAAAWDGDHIITVKEWEMEVIDRIPNQYLEYLDDLTGKKSGTLIVWEKIDRLLHNYRDLAGRQRSKGLETLLADLRDHLALVFHRFLDAEFHEAPTIEILVNDKPVIPWDPFGAKYANYEHPNMTTSLSEDSRRPILVTPYLLPREDAWSFSDDYRKVIRRDNELQGFYLYRANRLLQLPTWLGIGKQEPHANLARVKIEINSDWDEVLHVDVKKASVTFPPNLRDDLIKVKAYITNVADLQRRKWAKKPDNGKNPGHTAGDEAIERRKNQIPRPDVSEVDDEKSTATVRNTLGSLPGIRVVKPQTGLPGNIVVSPSGLDDGGLWAAIVVADSGASETAVELSSSHEFYRRVYLPASSSKQGKMAVDMLFWALSQAELNQSTTSNKNMFENFRFEIARTLRSLAQELPEVDEDQDENQDESE